MKDPYPPPAELLNDKIKELRRNLEKSVQAYENGIITKQIHQIHKLNITKHLKEYQSAFNKLLES